LRSSFFPRAVELLLFYTKECGNAIPVMNPLNFLKKIKEKINEKPLLE
jgi:hypothetical protein